MLKPLASGRAARFYFPCKFRLAVEGPRCRRGFSLILLVIVCVASRTAVAQANEWSWMGGSNTIDCSLPNGNCSEPGAYGTLGVPSAANIPGGRYGAVTWTDKDGNFWLFSGDTNSTGTDGQNDLWKFNPSTNQWTWVGGSNAINQIGVYGTLGVPAAGNIPGGRWVGSGWTDKNGDFWLFGGYGSDGNYCQTFLNDLWKYDPPTNQWTWMNGSNSCGQGGNYGTMGTPAAGNTPGARDFAASWTDKNGNFWLFGGQIGSSFGDMWEFTPSTNQWTWTGGTPALDQPGVYGTMGVPAASNIPGARWASNTWTDSDGNLWLFGGLGFDINQEFGDLNDLWKFDPSTRQWTWISGSNVISTLGAYDTVGIPSSANRPGPRSQGYTWTDRNGNLWLFGGNGFNNAGINVQLNDLFEYTPSTNLWTYWGGGSSGDCSYSTPSSCGPAGVYGTFATPAAANTPGGHGVGAAWVDNSGNFWLFGDQAVDSLGNAGNLNDLWRYQTSSVTLPAAATPAFSIAPGTYSSAQTVTLTDTTPGVTIYYTTLPISSWTPYTAPIAVSSTETIEAIAVGGGYSASTVATGAYQVQFGTTTELSVSPYPYISGTPITFTAQVSATSVSTLVPAGAVQFSVNGVALGLPVTLDTTGTATYNSTSLPVGFLSITAAYTPSTNSSFTASTSNSMTEAVYSSPRQTDRALFVDAERTLGSGFRDPYGVAVDGNENVFVADPFEGTVTEIVAGTGYTTMRTMGSGFGSPSGIALDTNANLFVADSFRNTVYEVTSAGGYNQVIDLGRGFQSPVGVALDQNNNLYVADTGHGLVKFIPQCTNCGSDGYGEATVLGSGFQYPWGVALDSGGNVFVTDVGNGTLNELTAASSYATKTTVGSDLFISPYGLAVDANNNILVTDLGYAAIREISETDGFTTVSTPASGLNLPLGVAVDTVGNVFVADTGNKAIRKISTSGGNFSPTAIGGQSQVLSMIFRFIVPTTLGSPAVVAQLHGPTSTDFVDAGTGTCKAATSYAANSTCSVNVLFTPTQAGARSGTVELMDNLGDILALGSLQGTGTN